MPLFCGRTSSIVGRLQCRRIASCAADSRASIGILCRTLRQTLLLRARHLHDQVCSDSKRISILYLGFEKPLVIVLAFYRFFHFLIVCLCFDSGPVVAAVLAREHAVEDWRAFIGPTDAAKARAIAPDRSPHPSPHPFPTSIPHIHSPPMLHCSVDMLRCFVFMSSLYHSR